MPTNATIAVRFDRFLDPATVNRQAILVYTGDRSLGSPFTFDVVYDPVERVAEFRLGDDRPYQPSTLYRYELFSPALPGDAGIRAFDGAPLAAGDLPLEGSFFTSDEPAPLPLDPPVPTCQVIVDQVFRGLGRCAGSECHRRGNNQTLDSMQPLGDAPHQLWLDEPGTFALSAINRVARQTDIGDISGGAPVERADAVVDIVDDMRVVRSPARRFGVRMGLIAPRSPGASYLLYKVLLNRDNWADCSNPSNSELCATPGPCESTHPALPLADNECIVPPEDELVRLREWFVKGEPMPRPDSLGSQGNVRIQGLRALSRFIAAGADCGQ